MWAGLDPRPCTKYYPSHLPSSGPGRVWLQQTDTTNRVVTSTSSETNKVDYWPCAKGLVTVLHIGVCSIFRYSWVQRATPRHPTVLSIISSVINNSTRELTVYKQLHITLISVGDRSVLSQITTGVIHTVTNKWIFYYTFTTTRVYHLSTSQGYYQPTIFSSV
jgi:hypothetical protein